MRRKSRLAALSIVVSLCTSASANAQELSKGLIGTWKLVSTEQRLTDGSTRPSPLYGANGVGYLIYSESGFMCAVLMDPNRPRWKAEDSPTEAELKAIANHFVSYCGRYEVNEKERSVVHHVELDVVPNNVGDKLVRFVALTGNTLKLRPAEPRDGIVEYTLTWERVVQVPSSRN
jgi:hypothetical protein